MDTGGCFLCRKHDGLEPQPPGGYVLQDANWLICHAPVTRGPLGTLFIESRRHILDHGDFNDIETATFAPLLRLVYEALRLRLSPQRIYLLSMMEGIPHFHAWIVPRMSHDLERGVAFLGKELDCTESQAIQVVTDLRTVLAPQWSPS